MAYYKIDPSGITSDAMALFYDDCLLEAIEEANSANIAFGKALLVAAGVWEMGGRTKRIVDAQLALPNCYGTAWKPGRHRMERHTHADLATVITMAQGYLHTAGYERGLVGWLDVVAPFQKEFPLKSWARRCLSLFTARRTPAEWTPSMPLHSVESSSPMERQS